MEAAATRPISPDLHPDLPRYLPRYLNHDLHHDLPRSPSPPIRRCKLCDFGTALEITEGAPLPTACIGSALYLAPEVESEQPYGLPADVFSFGVRAPSIKSSIALATALVIALLIALLIALVIAPVEGPL